MIIIGLDPGISGAIACLNSETNNTVCFPFPTKEKKGKGNEIDYSEYVSLYKNLTDGKQVRVFIENVHSMPGQGVASMFSFGYGAGFLFGVSKAFGHQVIKVSPQKWKRALDLYQKGKKETIELVSLVYPDVNLIPGKKRTPHDGMADALCIAYYGYSFYKG